MTYPSGEDMLEGLDVTPEERLAFLRAVDEADAEERGVDLDADPDFGDDELPEAGPWDDQMAQLGAIGETLDARAALDGQRIGEDIVAPPPREGPNVDAIRAALGL